MQVLFVSPFTFLLYILRNRPSTPGAHTHSYIYYYGSHRRGKKNRKGGGSFFSPFLRHVYETKRTMEEGMEKSHSLFFILSEEGESPPLPLRAGIGKPLSSERSKTDRNLRGFSSLR